MILTASVPTDIQASRASIVDFLNEDLLRINTPEERIRQEYGKKLHYEYGYPKEVMAFEVPITIGSSVKRADIVIFDSPGAAQRQDQTRILVVVETKAPDVITGEKQLSSYVMGTSAQGGVWVNGTDTPRYWRRIGHRFEPWVNVPRVSEDWDSIGRHTKAHLRKPHNLVETFRRCHNTLYRVGIDSEDLAMDMVRIILAKYQDELNEGEVCDFRCSALEIQTSKGRKAVADRVRDLFHKVVDSNRDVFGNSEGISAGDREIATVVAELQDFRFLPYESSDDTYDVVGAAYEVYIGSHLKGDRGQYFTHRLIVKMVVDIVDPSDDDVVLDVAMGSGGFLVAAMRHVAARVRASNRPSATKERAIQAFYRRLYGIDKTPKLVKVARTNMILASDGHSGLVRWDSLEPLTQLPEPLASKAGSGMPTIILTNPPFGATAEHRITADKDPDLLAQFDVAKVWEKDDTGALQPTSVIVGDGVPPEYLFTERCIRWVKPGGKIGIVLPRGVLDNDRALSVRTLIFRETRVMAVINCHDDTFKPYTDAKCAVLVLEKKGTPTDTDPDYPIFMAVSQGIGHDGLGFPVFKTDAKGDPILDSIGNPSIDHDTDAIAAAWHRSKRGEATGSDWYFRTTRRKIEQGLRLNPVRYLPKYQETIRKVRELGEHDEWTVERLGQIASVFGGQRLKRPYADKGVVSGPGIMRFFTGNAVTQTLGENVKYLDLAKAKPAQKRMIEGMTLRRGMILITRSGTVGRVVMATAYHDGAVGTEDVIRVVVENEALRGYVFQFLTSRLGQDQLRRNIYGAIVDHIEPGDVKSIQVPIPTNSAIVEAIGRPIIRASVLQEYATGHLNAASMLFAAGVEGQPLQAPLWTAPVVTGGPALSRRFAELADYRDGWCGDDEEAVAPPPDLLREVHLALWQMIEETGVDRPHVFAQPDGGLDLIWRRKIGTLSLRVAPGFQVEAVIVNRQMRQVKRHERAQGLSALHQIVREALNELDQ